MRFVERSFPSDRSCQRVLRSIFLWMSAVLLLCAAASAQVSYTGTAAAQNFGSVAIGSTSAATTFSFSVAAGTTVGSIEVVTQGAPNLDFNGAAGRTCMAETYAAATTCTVNVAFTPKAAGLRMGAVVFFSAAGNTGAVLGSALLYGVGTGPEIAYAPATFSGGFVAEQYPDLTSAVASLAVDAAGDVFVTDNSLLGEFYPPIAGAVELPAGGGAMVNIFPWVNPGYAVNPSGLAVDGAGNLFIADKGNSRILEVPTGGGAATAVDPTVDSIPLSKPTGLAVDGAGDLFIADTGNNRVVEMPTGGDAATSITPMVSGKTLSGPVAAAVDAAGDLFIVDEGNNRIVEVPAGGGAATALTPKVDGVGLISPTSIAVDGAGDLYITDAGNGRLLDLPPDGAPFVVSPSFVISDSYNGISWLLPASPGPVGADGAGNLFVAPYYSGYSAFEKLQRSQAPTLNFSTATPAGSLDTADGTETAQVVNVGNEALKLTAITYSANFPKASGDANACTGATTLEPGQHCDLPVEFSPEQGGALSGSVVLADNAQNVPGVEQSIALSGTGLATTGVIHFAIATSASVVSGRPFVITVTALDSLNLPANLYSGTVQFSSSDALFVNPGPLTLVSGVAQTTVTLSTVGNQSVTAADSGNSAWKGSASFNIPGIATFTGSAASRSFGSQDIGSASISKALSFSIYAGTEVGSIAAVTEGVANLDFAIAAGSTCVAQTYAAATNCTVNVKFTPQAAGLRMGAVVFYSKADEGGTLLGSAPVYGVGTGPQIAYAPGLVTGTQFCAPTWCAFHNDGVAVDGAGNVFSVDPGYSLLLESSANGVLSSVSLTVNGQAVSGPAGVAVDGTGDLFIADNGNNRVVERLADGGWVAIAPMANGKGLSGPEGVAVDGAGDLFILDFSHKRVVEVPSGGGTPTAIEPTVNGVALTAPTGAAVDDAGDLFIADGSNNRVLEVPAGGGAPIAFDPVANGKGLSYPIGVAVDGAGDLFIVDNGNNRVVEVPTGGGAPIVINTTWEFGPFLYPLGNPSALALDGGGDLFIAQYGNAYAPGAIYTVHRAQPPLLNFATATDSGAIDNTDGTETAQIINIGNGPLALTALSYPPDFPEVGGGANPCTRSISLTAGQQCDLLVEFAPGHSGKLSEDVTLTDNTLNVAGTTQLIAVTGSGKGADHFSVTSTATVVAGIPFSITVTALNTANQIETTYDGTVIFTSSDPLFVNPGPLTLSGGVGQATVTLKRVGTQTITATDMVTPALTGSGSFQPVYGVSTLASPTPGTTLGTSNVTFSWNAAYGFSHYRLYLGVNGPGSSDIYSSGQTSGTSVVVPPLPALGVTLYARLFTFSPFTSVWLFNDYTYTLAAPILATLTAPAPGTTVGYSNVTFTWTSNQAYSHYRLYLGVNGPGSSDMYSSSETSATAVVVPTLPALGVTLYARLFTLNYVTNVWQYNDYTYTLAGPILATLTSPSPGTTVGTSSVTFTWTPNYAYSHYRLYLGTRGPGSANVYSSSQTSATSVMVPTIPATGGMLYARLFTLNSETGVWQYNDYTYTLSGP
jgi:sugar lactone lactonase YvrE